MGSRPCFRGRRGLTRAIEKAAAKPGGRNSDSAFTSIIMVEKKRKKPKR